MLVQGTIWDNEQRPIPFANVTEKGTNNSVSADGDGEFSINVAGANSQLVFSHAGYDYDTIAAGEFNSYIELWPTQLDGATVYNNYKKPDNTGLIILGALAVVAVIAFSSGSKPKTVKA